MGIISIFMPMTAALGCLLAELLCLRPLFECEPPETNVSDHGLDCAPETFQLLTLVELLGSPNE